jgi:putative SOS response-associated peptidase YedK
MRWGLIPYWAKDAAIGAKAINAVSETAAEKPMFQDAMKRRRCLIPANGFYEWKKLGPKAKQAYHVGLANDGLFAFAGLWDRWKSPDGSVIVSCTILTTEANSLLKDVHDRMPVILAPEDYDLWLDPGITDPARVADLLKPYEARLMRKYPVNSTVNKVENDGPECAQEVEAESSVEQVGLFDVTERKS